MKDQRGPSGNVERAQPKLIGLKVEPMSRKILFRR